MLAAEIAVLGSWMIAAVTYVTPTASRTVESHLKSWSV